MKSIVMWLGIGNNESACARLMSLYPARVYLLKRGTHEQAEIWEQGSQTHVLPEKNVSTMRLMDDAFFSQPSALKCLLKTWPIARGQRIDLLVVGSNRATMACWLRHMGLVDKIVLLLSDHLPDTPRWPVRHHRHLVNAMIRALATRVDEVWSVSPRIPEAQFNPRNFVIPLYIDECMPRNPSLGCEIVYIGYPSEDHALDLLFALAGRHHWKLNIIGASPYLQAIASSAPSTTCFHGTITDRQRIGQIMETCACGYAIYRDTGPTAYSYYGIPSKLFYYLSNDIPVITTNTSSFSPEVERHHLGQLVQPDSESIERGILDLLREARQYRESIRTFRGLWNAGVESFIAQRLKTLLA